ncbi:HigA family addiction module antitoxin [Sphingomonas sp. GM_Shp_2]|uniref:HigA family addiction module antitoxin n=1 Tax=Sphingomonas sp. GM_Shp_2 TaxID=2937380 RepID=UPI002269C868|nr:HigA family addiction module antitoxin [Sphingomonas sp. GM_Shp_2]
MVSAAFMAAPPRPADVLKRHFMTLDSVTQQGLADALGVSRLTVSELLNDKRAITAPMALRLAQVLGTDAEFWLNLQLGWDLHRARLDHGDEAAQLVPLRQRPTQDDVVRPAADRRGRFKSTPAG